MITPYFLLQQSPVVPVIVIQDVELAVDLAHALAAGGIRVLEITLRSTPALEAIRRLRDAVPNCLIGAGSIRSSANLQAAMDVGAQFGISPGLTRDLARAIQNNQLPFIPGVGSISEAMQANDYGFTVQKLFPAEAVGGLALLKALSGPLPDLRFCPTGGIHIHNAQSYLSLPNVLAVGGSWLAPEPLVAARNWSAITALAQEASALQVDL